MKIAVTAQETGSCLAHSHSELCLHDVMVLHMCGHTQDLHFAVGVVPALAEETKSRAYPVARRKNVYTALLP